MHETRYDSENQFNLLRRAEACVFSCCSHARILVSFSFFVPSCTVTDLKKGKIASLMVDSLPIYICHR